MSQKQKIFAFLNGQMMPGLVEAMAIHEDGTPLATHACSREEFIPHDLGVTGDWKHDVYDGYCGTGNWEIEFVPSEQIATHRELQAAFKKGNEASGEKAEGQ